jgi:hypothetical protein
MSPTNSKDFSPLECDSLLSFKSVSSEAQDGEKPLSMAALKANLFYAEALNQKAQKALMISLFNYHLTLTALNVAIVRRNSDA